MPTFRSLRVVENVSANCAVKMLRYLRRVHKFPLEFDLFCEVHGFFLFLGFGLFELKRLFLFLFLLYLFLLFDRFLGNFVCVV